MNKTICLIASGFLLMATGCGRQDFKKAPDGTEYKIIGNSNGKRAVTGDVMEMNMTVKYKDSLLYNSVEASAPQFIPFDTAQMPPFFKDVREGDSLVIRQSTDSILKYGQAQAPPFMKKGEYIYRTFKIVKLFPSQEAADSASEVFKAPAKAYNYKKAVEAIQKEIADDDSLVKADEQSIKDYMAKNNLTGTKTKWGTWVVIESDGTGPTLSDTDVAEINYSGRTMADDSTFDSNTNPKFGHPEPLYVDLGEFRVIPGWVDGLKMMKKGSKGKLLIPSYLAYRAAGRPPKIGPNANLIFDIEVTDVLNQQQYQVELDKQQKQMLQQRQLMQQLQQMQRQQQQQKQQQQNK